MVLKAFNHALSVDDWIKNLGIPLVYKCDCCMHGGYEDQNHALAACELAREIWEKARVLVGIPYVPRQGW